MTGSRSQATSAEELVPGFSRVRPQLWIGGEWVDAVTGATMSVTDPADETEIVAVADGNSADMRRAVEAAAAARGGWRESSPRDRAEVLRRAYEFLTAAAEDFAQLIVRENGKALADARGEVAYAAEFFRWFSEEAVRLEGTLMAAPSGRHRIMTLLEPVGVSVLVTPWNFPAAMITRKVAPALAAGCPVVIKPPSETPLTCLALADLLDRAGVPAGVVNVVTTSTAGPVVEAALEEAEVRKLSFTGSTAVGRLLLGQAASRVVNTSMELGGNAPFLVCDDADLDGAVAAAMVAKMRNGGASCIAANRFIVADRVAEGFVERLSHAMGALRVGPGLDVGTDVGPMVSRRERDRLSDAVAQARDGGVRVVHGGGVPERSGWFYTPTVLDAVSPRDPLVQDEIFGPVAAVTTVESEEEMLAVANATEHGLAGYVCSSNLSRALRLAECLDVGMVGVNRGLISDPAAPFGGVKQSGIGREGGHQGVREFCESKYIAADW